LPAQSHRQRNNITKNNMKNIAQKLGIAPEAGEDAILAEVARLQNRLSTLEPLEAEMWALFRRASAMWAFPEYPVPFTGAASVEAGAKSVAADNDMAIQTFI
jgi:hypothetical protein